MQTILAQNTKLMAMLEVANTRKAEPDVKAPGGGGGPQNLKKKLMCKHCKKVGVHDNNDCFSLPKNKDKKATGYKEE